MSFIGKHNLFLMLIFTNIGLETSCGHAPDAKEQEQLFNKVNSRMPDVNKIMVANESDEIEAYIKRHNWTMESSGTGLRYHIYMQGMGKSVEAGDKVTVSFQLSLLNGEVCYTNADKKAVTFIMQQGQQTNGLEEGLTLMKEGGKSRLIVPAHLGYGLMGDGEKVPQKAVLVYDVALLKIEKKITKSLK